MGRTLPAFILNFLPMALEFLQETYDTRVVGLSVLIAAFASYVALDLARRVRTHDVFSSVMWAVGGALVMGSGIWSMHFVGMLAMELPVSVGYDPATTFLSWLAAVGVSALALTIAARDRLSPTVLLSGAVAMGGGICVMHYTGMAALQMQPGIVWDPWLVAASAAIAIGASSVALVIFFRLRALQGMRMRLAQAGAALIMGLAISGMHYTGMAAAGFQDGSICLSIEGLRGSSLGSIIVVATVILLSLTLFTSILDARMRDRASNLARSLKQANEQLQGANAELQRLAFADPLTGLANRVLFEDRLEHALSRLDRAQTRPAWGGKSWHVAVLFIDLDGFKLVNDSYGHAAGDVLLRQVAERLRLCVREPDTLARVGGDEFVVLLDDITSSNDAVQVATRILESMAQAFQLPERPVALTCSIGIVNYPDQAHGRKLVASADAAMYAAKRAGGGTYAIFEPHMSDGAADQGELQQALREALEQGRLRLHYQPKVDGRNGHLIGLEALLRWTHPTRGPISPTVFVPIAERSGQIVAIGNWVIDEACRQLASWARDGHRLRVSINLSAYQLRQGDVAEKIQQALYRHDLDADQMMCEITESVAMEDTVATQRVIEKLTALGIQLSIDDFGTGFSSLASLRQFAVHELKLDRSFVKDVAVRADARAVVDAVVRLAHALNLSVVAEGVETPEQRDALVELGCDELQGFYFARPLDPDAVLSSNLLTKSGSLPRLTLVSDASPRERRA